MNRNPIKLHDIFCIGPGKRAIKAEELFAFDLNPVFINDLCDYLNLLFDESTSEGNVCFANNKEVRSEFRTTFSKSDVISLICSMHAGRKDYPSTMEVFFPEDPTTFWTGGESINKRNKKE